MATTIMIAKSRLSFLFGGVVGDVIVLAGVGGAKVTTGVPHFWQKCAFSSSLVPHLWQ